MTKREIDKGLEALYERLDELMEMKEALPNNPFESDYLLVFCKSLKYVFHIKETQTDGFNHPHRLFGTLMYVEGPIKFEEDAFLLLEDIADKNISAINKYEFSQYFDAGLERIQQITY